MTLKKVRIQIEGNVGEYICVLHNMVNIFSFLLGSGKSTLANMLKEVLCNEYSIESDVFLEPGPCLVHNGACFHNGRIQSRFHCLDIRSGEHHSFAIPATKRSVRGLQ